MPRLTIIEGPGLFHLSIALTYTPRRNPHYHTPTEFFVAGSLDRSDPFWNGATLKVNIDQVGRRNGNADDLLIEGSLISIYQRERLLKNPHAAFKALYQLNQKRTKGWVEIGDVLAGLCYICWSKADHKCNACHKLLCADDAINHGASAADAPHQVQRR